MVRLPIRARVLAVCLSATAGYVDALGFLSLGGFFVSFMSGNSTRLGIGLAKDSHQAALAAGLILVFVIGAGIGSAVGMVADRRRPVAVLALITLLLFAAASLASMGRSAFAIVLTVLAMGAENAIFQDGGEVRVGLTYMTGALVKLGQKIAAIPFGGDRLAWLPDLMLWGGLVAGATAGAFAYPRIGLAGLWVAAAAVAMLTLVVLLSGLRNSDADERDQPAGRTWSASSRRR